MTDYSKVKVGDTVWFSDVNRRSNELSSATVVKVGPKLITVEMYSRTTVFRKDNGRTNDDYQQQTLILDLELYEAKRKVNAAMSDLRYRISRPNEGVTYADIIAAARLLKIDIE